MKKKTNRTHRDLEGAHVDPASLWGEREPCLALRSLPSRERGPHRLGSSLIRPHCVFFFFFLRFTAACVISGGCYCKWFNFNFQLFLKKQIDFCIMALYPAVLPNSLTPAAPCSLQTITLSEKSSLFPSHVDTFPFLVSHTEASGRGDRTPLPYS